MSDQHGSDITQYETPEAPGDLMRAVGGTPVVGGVSSLATNIYGSIAGDDRLSSAASIPADIAGIGMNALLAVRDPIYALVNAGLGFVLELVQPLQDLMDWLAGDSHEMERQGEVWGQVGDALEALSGETGETLRSNLTSWSGGAAEAAFEQLYAMEAAVMAAAHESRSVQTILGWAQALAEAVYGVVRSIVAELVSWLVTYGLVALANSAWTFGASVASFLLGAAAKGFHMFTQAMNWVSKGGKVFQLITKVMMKFLGNHSLRGLGMTGGRIWLQVLKKAGAAVGIKAGLGLLQGAGTAAGTVSNSLSSGGGSGGAGQGPVTVDLQELEGAAGGLEDLAGNAGAIQDIAQEASVTELAWGLLGSQFFEQDYLGTTEALAEAITAIEDALNGNAVKLRGSAEDYRSADDEAAEELNRILAEFES